MNSNERLFQEFLTYIDLVSENCGGLQVNFYKKKLIDGQYVEFSIFMKDIESDTQIAEVHVSGTKILKLSFTHESLDTSELTIYSGCSCGTFSEYGDIIKRHLEGHVIL